MNNNHLYWSIQSNNNLKNLLPPTQMIKMPGNKYKMNKPIESHRILIQFHQTLIEFLRIALIAKVDWSNSILQIWTRSATKIFKITKSSKLKTFNKRNYRLLCKMMTMVTNKWIHKIKNFIQNIFQLIQRVKVNLKPYNSIQLKMNWIWIKLNLNRWPKYNIALTIQEKMCLQIWKVIKINHLYPVINLSNLINTNRNNQANNSKKVNMVIIVRRKNNKMCIQLREIRVRKKIIYNLILTLMKTIN